MKKHFTPTEHFESFLSKTFTLAYIFFICLFISTSEFLTEIVIPRYIYIALQLKFSSDQEKRWRTDFESVLLKHSANDFDSL